MGFAWGSWLQWPVVFKLEGQVLKLEGLIYYVDPKFVGSMGFLGGKEGSRIPINSKHSSLEALKCHIIEFTGLKAESEKHGLGSSIEIKLCQLEKSAEGSKVYAINNDDNQDEMTFLRAIATRSGSKGKSKDVPFEYYTPSALVIISLPPPTFHCMFT